jgi:hypothetical protein
MSDTKSWYFQHVIMGHIAMWAVRQSPYHNPDKLDEVLAAWEKRSAHVFDKNGMAKLTNTELRLLVKEGLMQDENFLAWNERRNGNQAPFKFTSRYDGPGDPDDDFIDLDALIGNVYRTVRQERERDDASYAEFERSWRRSWLKRHWFSLWYKINPPKISTPETPTA